MTRRTSFHDQQFRDPKWDPDDLGEFIPNLVFIGMAFDRPGMDEVHRTIKDECKKLHLKTIRVDENVGSGLVIRDIVKLIEDAEFLVFDLTHERPNVYYELGYAHGVGNEAGDVLLLAREGTCLHFDVAPMRVHYYVSSEQLREVLGRSLTEMIRITRRLG
jgi:hypothetical protein